MDRISKLFAVGACATALFVFPSCKQRSSSAVKEVNQQSPFVDGGESGIFFSIMHDLVTETIASFGEIQKKHKALFKASTTPGIQQALTDFKSSSEKLAADINALSQSFDERLKNFRQTAAGSESVSSVEFTLASNYLKAAYAKMTATAELPSYITSMSNPQTFQIGWQRSMQALGRASASPEPKAVGGYLASVESFLVKWELEATHAQPAPDQGPIVIPTISTLSACPPTFAQPNLAGIPVINSDPDKIKAQAFCYDFAVNLAKTLESDQPLLVALRKLLPKGLSVTVTDNGPPTFSSQGGMELTLPVGINAAGLAPLKAAINQAVNLAIIRFGQGTNLVEVSDGANWYGVCDDNFDPNDGKVVCRMVGKNFVSWQTSNGGDKFLFDDLNCDGTELSLFDCPHIGSDQENCGAGENVAVVCQ